MQSIKLPKGASGRYRKLEALGRQVEGRLYDDMFYSYDQESGAGKNHINLSDRRPSTQFNLAYEITQDTCAELFGDEQFPIVHVHDKTSDEDDAATEELRNLFDVVDLPTVMVEAYEEGVVGSVGVVMHRSDDGTPYYEVLPGKFCQPMYRSEYSNELIALVVTYPITRDVAFDKFPTLKDVEENKREETFWYRYVVGPRLIIDYIPLPDSKYAHLGEKDDRGVIIAFEVAAQRSHGFKGRVPAVYQRNFGGRGRDVDGMALWWPIVDICVMIDRTLSQAGRGLQYSADPTLFIRRGELDLSTGLYDKPAGGMATLVQGGQRVTGPTQTLVGQGKDSDAKLLEINASGIKEEREFVADLREYALEVVGGMRARAQHASGPTTGRAIDKTLKPLRRLVRRQRRPYGRGLLSQLADLTIYGFVNGVFESPEVDITKIPEGARLMPSWPTEDTLQGQDLLYHAQGLQIIAGGSPAAPLQLIDPKKVAAKTAADLGLNEPMTELQGTMKAQPVPGAAPGVTTP